MKTNKAFTLVEVLVSMVVMTIVMTAVLSSMINFLQTSKRLHTMRSLQQETTFALSRISDKIRGFSIDYEAYQMGGGCQATNLSSSDKLCLGEGHIFEKNGDKLLFQWKNAGGILYTAPLFSENVVVQNILFEGTPEEDPTSPTSWGDSALQRQPRVDIVLEVTAVSDTSISYRVETSLSSRVY